MWDELLCPHCQRVIHLYSAKNQDCPTPTPEPTLTPHEIQRMPAGGELDAEIATRMGWRYYWQDDSGPCGWQSPEGVRWTTWTWDYSVDDKCALKLVDDLYEKYNLGFTMSSARKVWTVSFYTHEQLGHWGIYTSPWTAIADARSLAIARAALLVLVGMEASTT